MTALEQVASSLAELERLRALEVCLLVPALEPGFLRAFFVSGGRVVAVAHAPARRRGPRRDRGRARGSAAEPPAPGPEDTDELLLVGSFLRRPPPELRVVPLDAERILAA